MFTRWQSKEFAGASASPIRSASGAEIIFRMSVVSFVLQMDPDNKPTREELKEEVLKVSKGLVGLGGFNLVSASCPHYRTLLLVLVCAICLG